MDDLLPYIIENHDRVRASKSRLTAARNRAREALGDWFPTLSQTANAGHETQENDNGDDTRTGFHEWDISLTQLLWDFGSTNAAIDKARLQVEAARYDLIETRQSLILEAITAYLNLVRSHQALKFAKESEESIRRQGGLEEALVELGSGFSSDVLRAKGQLAGAQARVAQNEGALVNAYNRYKAVFGRMPDDIDALEPVPFPASFMPLTLTQATDIALESNPSLKSAILDADIAVEDVRIARADNFFPKIEGTAERKFKKNVGGTIGAEQETLAKVEMTIDFNLGLTAVNTLRASESDLSATTFTAADTRRNIEEQVRNAWQQLDTAKRTAAHLNNQSNIEAAFLELAREERQRGLRTLLEVLDSEIKYINARSDALSSETDVLIASYGILAATGLLEYDIIKRSKGTKPPSFKLPGSPPSAATPQDAPAPAPVQPVTPVPGQQIDGSIDPDVTVAAGRSSKELQDLFTRSDTADVSRLPDTVQTFGQSMSGSLVARPQHPPKPKSRYGSFEEIEPNGDAFTPGAKAPEVEFASSDLKSAAGLATDDAIPYVSDTAADSSTYNAVSPSASRADTAEPYETFMSADDQMNIQATRETAPTNEADSQVAALPKDAPEHVAGTESIGFSFDKIFTFLGRAHERAVEEKNERQVTSTSVAMDVPPMPIPDPETRIEVAAAPAQSSPGDGDTSGSDPVTQFIGNVIAFFDAGPARTAAPDNAETANIAPEIATSDTQGSPGADDAREIAALPSADGSTTEPAGTAESKGNLDTLMSIIRFLDAGHQRAVQDKKQETARSTTAPEQPAEPSDDTDAGEKHTKASPSLFAFFSNLFDIKGIDYTPAEGNSMERYNRR
ncbi:MAG: TolC family protein [Rhodospirillales bacterium]|nr:TolC family protein [Rhodospirillales bacterium]MBO6786381.1 TolC family protein [Rhodospirillales bacterium]